MKSMSVRCAVLAVFLLMGGMTFERLGMDNLFGVPERALAAVLVFSFVFLPTKLGNQVARASFRGASWRPTIAIVLYSILSLLWAPAAPGTEEVAVDLVCVLVLVLTVMELLREDARGAIDSLALWLALAGCLYAAAGLAATGSAARISAFGGGPNVYGRVTAIGAMAALHVVMRGRHSWLAFTVPLQFVASILSGSRGAMVALGLSGLMILPWVLRTGNIRKYVVILLACTPALVLADHAFGERVSSVVMDRLWKLTVLQRYSSGREDFWASSIELFRAHPIIGAGVQGWEAHYGQYLGQKYPHNIVLQFASELGIVGLMLLSLTLLGVVRIQRWGAVFQRTGQPHFAPSLFATQAAIFCFVGMQFSGGHYDARYLWLFVIMASCPLQVEGEQVAQSRVVRRPAGLRRPLHNRQSGDQRVVSRTTRHRVLKDV